MRVVTPGGQRFTGTVERHLPGQTLVGSVRELDDGWFRLLTWKDASGSAGVWAWISTYTGEDRAGGGVEGGWPMALARLFPG